MPGFPGSAPSQAAHQAFCHAGGRGFESRRSRWNKALVIGRFWWSYEPAKPGVSGGSKRIRKRAAVESLLPGPSRNVSLSSLETPRTAAAAAVDGVLTYGEAPGGHCGGDEASDSVRTTQVGGEMTGPPVPPRPRAHSSNRIVCPRSDSNSMRSGCSPG